MSSWGLKSNNPSTVFISLSKLSSPILLVFAFLIICRPVLLLQLSNCLFLLSVGFVSPSPPHFFGSRASLCLQVVDVDVDRRLDQVVVGKWVLLFHPCPLFPVFKTAARTMSWCVWVRVWLGVGECERVCARESERKRDFCSCLLSVLPAWFPRPKRSSHHQTKKQLFISKQL